MCSSPTAFRLCNLRCWSRFPKFSGATIRNNTIYDNGLNGNSMIARPWDKPEALHPTTWAFSESLRFLTRRDPGHQEQERRGATHQDGHPPQSPAKRSVSRPSSPTGPCRPLARR